MAGMAKRIEDDGCFVVLEDSGGLLVSEQMHDRRPGPLTWRIASTDLRAARASIERHRRSHDLTYHTDGLS